MPGRLVRAAAGGSRQLLEAGLAFLREAAHPLADGVARHGAPQVLAAGAAGRQHFVKLTHGAVSASAIVFAVQVVRFLNLPSLRLTMHMLRPAVSFPTATNPCGCCVLASANSTVNSQRSTLMPTAQAAA